MTVDDAIALVEQILQPEGLNDLQETVFRYCWDGLSYQDIADEIGYDPGYIRTVGSRLWKQLGDYHWGIEQVQELALRYGLDWIKEDAFHDLLATVGGHPYLVQLALYYVWERNLSIEEILRDAATDAGIYGSHLRRLLEILNSSPELCSAMKKVVKSDQPVEFPPIVAYKLQSMGLVKLVGNWVTIRYKIYHDYLRSRLN